jgi:hypothetical protein
VSIRGVLGCYDRVVVSGICYAEGMTAHLDSNKIHIFDHRRFAEPCRDANRADTGKVAAAAEVIIEFIQGQRLSKADRVQKIIAERGNQSGLVHIFSAHGSVHAAQAVGANCRKCEERRARLCASLDRSVIQARAVYINWSEGGITQ